MFKINDLTKEIHIQGRSVNLKKASIEELKIYSSELQKKEDTLIEKQNSYLSEILR